MNRISAVQRQKDLTTQTAGSLAPFASQLMIFESKEFCSSRPISTPRLHKLTFDIYIYIHWKQSVYFHLRDEASCTMW